MTAEAIVAGVGSSTRQQVCQPAAMRMQVAPQLLYRWAEHLSKGKLLVSLPPACMLNLPRGFMSMSGYRQMFLWHLAWIMVSSAAGIGLYAARAVADQARYCRC